MKCPGVYGLKAELQTPASCRNPYVGLAVSANMPRERRQPNGLEYSLDQAPPAPVGRDGQPYKFHTRMIGVHSGALLV